MIALLVISVLASVTDVRTRTIPNGCCLGIALCGLALQAMRSWAPGLLAALPLTGWLAAVLPPPASCVIWGVGMLAGGVTLELLRRAFVGREGMGLGDVKLLAAWAAGIGWLVLPALALACLAGALFAIVRRERTFAMAPWLTAGFLAVLVLARFAYPSLLGW